MGHFVTSADIPVDGEKLKHPLVRLVQIISGAVGLIGLAIGIYIWLGGPGISDRVRGSYSYSYLFAFSFFMTLTLGGCFWTLLHNVTNSGWGTSVRRIFENLGFVFPFMFILMIPFFFPKVQDDLWEWHTIYNNVTHAEKHDKAHKAGAHNQHDAKDTGDHKAEVPSRYAGKIKVFGAEVPHGGFYGTAGNDLLHNKLLDEHESILDSKSWYMNPVAWYIRAVYYFLSLGFVIYLARRLSVKQDTDPNPGVKNLFKARAYASWGLPIFGVALTFWAIDFIKALDYLWFSTMWGVYFFAGCAMSSMAFIILTTIILRKLGYLKKVVSVEHFHLMGKLNFAFVVFWAYVTFSQFFLYWYANITEETTYYLLRNTEGWNIVSMILVVGHFGIPLLALIRQDVKKNMFFMAIITIYLLAIHFLDVYHMIIPERAPSLSIIQGLNDIHLWFGDVVWLDFLAFLTIGGAFLFFFIRNLTSVALYPHRDPRILESANVHN